MKEKWFSTSLLALWFLVCSGLALGCDWDQTVDPNQDLDPVAMLTLGIMVDRAVSVYNPEECQKLCCNDPNCDLALVGFPMDGPKQCLQVNCWVHGQDQCNFRNSSQHKVYRKKVDPKTRAAQDGNPHILPLLLDREPKAVETNQTNDIICRQPVKVGSCRAAFPKFFYNVTDQSCSSFIYGGCDGNGNNFDSQDECEKTCSGVTGPVLNDLTPDPAAKSPRMAPAFYPELSKEADSPAEFETTESVHNHETEMSANEYAVQCELEPEAGPCRAAFRRWFYNRKTGDCETFTYGGCRGNKNNYDSKESCTAACTIFFNSHREDHQDRTAAFFLFITLAVISALLLVAVVIVSLRRHRRSWHSSSSDKQELLPEGDTCSSQESLSVPDSPKPDKA
ncbi:Kunitz-type protease inhibitor 2 Hepatocyte growth factor activator inhibitor type 2 [Channa argus]|uniref:Kunitz-type protease inhibitor 2 Hepatocyte growth factor activator inhibitor type 2 n=1 Tax=Channa argus TaxID=215402 RepID=A0A6G1PTJ4_CHAAH|nr:Kunitz-type protease inhibitor 2 Hepatocyte growth factor activator inhibitor type 2 [Channa argus]KAK2913182.1 hypothetical protein Q8A73_007295 [Channa argus]